MQQTPTALPVQRLERDLVPAPWSRGAVFVFSINFVTISLLAVGMILDSLLEPYSSAFILLPISLISYAFLLGLPFTLFFSIRYFRRLRPRVNVAGLRGGALAFASVVMSCALLLICMTTTVIVLMMDD